MGTAALVTSISEAWRPSQWFQEEPAGCPERGAGQVQPPVPSSRPSLEATHGVAGGSCRWPRLLKCSGGTWRWASGCSGCVGCPGVGLTSFSSIWQFHFVLENIFLPKGRLWRAVVHAVEVSLSLSWGMGPGCHRPPAWGLLWGRPVRRPWSNSDLGGSGLAAPPCGLVRIGMNTVALACRRVRPPGGSKLSHATSLFPEGREDCTPRALSQPCSGPGARSSASAWSFVRVCPPLGLGAYPGQGLCCWGISWHPSSSAACGQDLGSPRTGSSLQAPGGGVQGRARRQPGARGRRRLAALVGCHGSHSVGFLGSGHCSCDLLPAALG